MKRHIAMVASTAPSHIYPSLGLFRELVRRGHEITYIVGEPLRNLPESIGARVVTHRTGLPLGDTPWPEDIGKCMQLFLDDNRVALDVAARALESRVPDLFLFDIGGYAARLLARRWNKPAAQLSQTYVAWDGYEEDMKEALAPLDEMESVRSYYKNFGEWLRENGIEQDPKQWVGRPERILSLIPKPMQPNADRVPKSVMFVGPCLELEDLESKWKPPAPGRRVLLVAFGTAYNEKPDFFRKCIEAFRGSDWHVVLSIGKRVSAADLGTLPENIEAHSFVPQLAVLNHASAFVTHAGMGSCTEALWFGVPTIALPQAVDQFTNADRLVELGVGEKLDEATLTPTSLREAVERVAGSKEMRERLNRIRSEIHAAGGISRAADAVEELVGARSGKS